MTSMPIITDRMVVQFQRSGKRRGSYRSARGGRAPVGAQRVVLQGSAKCSNNGGLCTDENGVLGKCIKGVCVKNPFPGPNPFEF